MTAALRACCAPNSIVKGLGTPSHDNLYGQFVGPALKSPITYLMLQFRWIPWNTQHIARHGVTPEEAEWVVGHPTPGYPRKHKGGYIVWGQTPEGRWLQVAFARDDDETRSVFVYHARPLTDGEKRRVRR